MPELNPNTHRDDHEALGSPPHHVHLWGCDASACAGRGLELRCVMREEAVLPRPRSRHKWFRAQFPDSPFKGPEPFLKQRHPRKVRLDVSNLASLQAPSPRSENNIGYLERQCSFCLHFISSQEMIFSNIRPPWVVETPAQRFPLSPYFQNLCAWSEWAFDEYQKGNILTHSFSLRGKIF